MPRRWASPIARQRNARRAGNAPTDAVPEGKLQMERPIEVFEEPGTKLRKRASPGSETERHEMARAVVRANRLLPSLSPVEATGLTDRQWRRPPAIQPGPLARGASRFARADGEELRPAIALA